MTVTDTIDVSFVSSIVGLGGIPFIAALVQILKAFIKEIDSAVSSLRMKFPHIKSDEEDELKKEAEKIDIEFEGYVKQDNEMDKLERELFALREKLKEVG